MKQYLDLVQHIFDHGSWQDNRNGIRTLRIPGAMMRLDLQEGFPAITTKKLAFKTAIRELIGFIRGYRSAADFRALGCKFWDQNANEDPEWLASPYRLEEDDLGPFYGVQWRQWPAYKLIDLSQPKSGDQIADALNRGYRQIGIIGDTAEPGKSRRMLLYKAIDQLRHCLDTIIDNPGHRRILFSGWNCAQLEEMVLSPCHVLYQFLVDSSKQEISLCLYIRANDIGLGAPLNLVGSAALLHLVGRLTGYTPRWLSYFIGDAHIYENHVEMLREQLKREPFPAPRLVLSDRIPDYAVTRKYEPEWLETVEPSDFWLQGYQHHGTLKAPWNI